LIDEAAAAVSPPGRFRQPLFSPLPASGYAAAFRYAISLPAADADAIIRHYIFAAAFDRYCWLLPRAIFAADAPAIVSPLPPLRRRQPHAGYAG
jgi:hypothetical protein